MDGFFLPLPNPAKSHNNDTQLTHAFESIAGVESTVEPVRLAFSSPAHYATRLARDAGEIRAAQALRFEVFNVELNEGLEQSFATGLDEDPFDAVCDHLIVEHLPSQNIVGTYRLQTGANAANHLGYYSAQEFEFQVFESLRNEIVELGRACVHIKHRNLVVLGLLWKGIAGYAKKPRRPPPFGLQFHHVAGPGGWRVGLLGIVPETSGAAAVADPAQAGI